MIEEHRIDENNTVRTYLAEGMESPREWDNLGQFYTDESRCDSPDKKPRKHLDALESAAFILGVEPDCEKMHTAGIVLAVYKYEHSGVAYSTSPFSCPWDSGQVGYIACAFDKIKKEYGAVNEATISKARACLQNEVAIYSNWANGNVYGYQVENQQGDVEDSCWGFYDYDQMLSEAIASHK